MNDQQIHFSFGSLKNSKPYFGGSNLKSNPKTARPISTKELMHVVIKANRAKGKLSFLKKEREIIVLINRLSLKFNVKIKDVVVMSNHIHVLLRAYQRPAFQNFLRALSGLVVRKAFQTERSRPLSYGKVLEGRPFSRIVNRGMRSYRNIKKYFDLNRLEKYGFSKSESRANRLHCLAACLI